MVSSLVGPERQGRILEAGLERFQRTFSREGLGVIVHQDDVEPCVTGSSAQRSTIFHYSLVRIVLFRPHRSLQVVLCEVSDMAPSPVMRDAFSEEMNCDPFDNREARTLLPFLMLAMAPVFNSVVISLQCHLFLSSMPIRKQIKNRHPNAAARIIIPTPRA
jgi:hypothetical protein